MRFALRAGVAASIASLTFVMLPVAPAAGDAVRDAQWHLRFLDVAQAHRYSQGEGVAVAVIDTGVDGGHPDLADSVLPGGDLAGQTDGRQDLEGHGTAMAGLIAGHGAAGMGALGIAPMAKILPVRTGAGAGDFYRLGGIDWAVRNGATVICAAFSTTDSAELRQEVSAALAADVVVVAAAGNVPESTAVDFPAAYEGVIAAAGVDQNGRRAAISIAGERVVLAAPAVEIVSTGLYRKYRTGTGTSDATAIIAGAAALVRAKYPQLSAREVVHRLVSTADDKGPPGRDPEYGYGVVNLVAALTRDVPPLPGASPSQPVPSGSPTGDSGSAGPRGDGRLSPVAIVFVGLGLLLVAAAGGTVLAVRRSRD